MLSWRTFASKRHDWGYGCDDCPACELRKTGYQTWRALMSIYASKKCFYTLQGEGGQSWTAGRVLPLCGLQSLVGAGARPRHARNAHFATLILSAPMAKMAASLPMPMQLGRCHRRAVARRCHVGADAYVVFTGGEPCLQLDTPLLDALHGRAKVLRCAIETNGTLPVPAGRRLDLCQPQAAIGRSNKHAATS